MNAAILSWGGCVLLLWGLKRIGDKRLSGFYIASVAELMWIAWGLLTNAQALIVMSAAILVMYVRAIWSWGRGQ